MTSKTIASLQWRYATKKFDPSKVISEEKLDILKHSFNLTATSYGLQPIKLIVIRNTKIKEQLVPITMDQVQVKDASHVLVFCIESKLTADYIRAYFDSVERIRNTPRVILMPFETFLVDDFSEKAPETIEEWMEKQAYLAMGNLLTVCAIEGIDACPIEGFEPEKYDDILKLKEKGLRSVLVMPVGYRAEDDMFADFKKVRRGVDEVVIDIN
jgi:nitroreductase/dihydropteridine reductase